MEDRFIKIINATYKVLDFFPDTDPLKNKAKEKTLAILENLTLLSEIQGWSSLKKEKIALQLVDDIEVLESYLILAKHQNWIDNINFLILTNEYHKIKYEQKPTKESSLNVLQIGFSDQSAVKAEYAGNAKQSQLNDEKKTIVLQTDHIGKASVRQRTILKIITQKGRVQVADIIKELPDITKRTIRRDLYELLKIGKIVRVGEWNRTFYQIS